MRTGQIQIMYMSYADVWRPNNTRPAFIYDVMTVLAGALCVALLAQVAFELPGGVPITGQTFGVLLVGMVLGSKRGDLVKIGLSVVVLPDGWRLISRK